MKFTALGISLVLLASGAEAQTLKVVGQAYDYPWGDYDNISVTARSQTSSTITTKRWCLWPADASALVGYLNDWLANGCSVATGTCYHGLILGTDQKCLFGRQRAAGGSSNYYDLFSIDVACRDSIEGKLWLIVGSGETTGGGGGDNAYGLGSYIFELNTAEVETLRTGLDNWYMSHVNAVLFSK